MGADRKMRGRLGWHGQCSCCSGPGDAKAEEKREATGLAWDGVSGFYEGEAGRKNS